MTSRHKLLPIIITIGLLCIWHSEKCRAQHNRLFTTEHDLPNSLVNKVREDADEMIWIATEDGLCRFDGSRVKTYRHEADNPHSIQSNFIRTICTDERGHVLIASTAGLQLYRPATDDFSALIINEEAGIRPGNVSDLQILQSGDILATGNTTFTLHFDDEGQPSAIANPFTEHVRGTFRALQDPRGDIWVIKFNSNVYRLRHGTDSIHTISDVAFSCIGAGPDGAIYAAGLNTGIYRYNDESDRFDLFTPSNILFTAREFCQVPGTQLMYIATDGNGILQLDCQTGQVSPLVLDDARIDARSQKVHSFCFSRHGDLWVALYQKGLLVHVRNPLNFHYYGPRSMRYDCIGDQCVTTLLRTHDKRIWVGTDNGGIYGINDEGHKLRHIPIRTSFSSQQGSLPSALLTLFEDSRHRVWFGSYGQGGGIVNLETGDCRYMPVEGQDGSRTNIYAYAEDKRGRVWVASMGVGILYYDEEQHKLRGREAPDAVCWCTSMRYDEATDCLYVGTYNGLSVLALDGHTQDSQVLEGYVINSLTHYDDTHLSLSTDHGIVIYDITTGSHVSYTIDDGLPKGGLSASEADNEGNLWVSGSAGLSKLNVRQGTFTNYTTNDGVKTTEFYKNAAMRDADGTLWFGGTDGITWFHPEEILPPTAAFDVRVVGLHADQNDIHATTDDNYHISDDEHSFTIELATRPILATNSVIYRYSMDDDPWQTLMPMMNSVSFSHIASGRHTFRFQAVSGEQASDIRHITISIDYPWYCKWWAIMIWISILLLLLAQVWHAKREHARRRQARQAQAINEAKLQFFMNIAHEFRTPMTLIVSPLQRLIATDLEPAHQHVYQLIDRNANRILNLINQMMDLRRIDTAQMQLRCQRHALLPLIREQISLVSDISEARKVDTRLQTTLDDQLTLWLDRDHFEKILLNLLSNALKFTPEGGYIEVSCRRHEASERYPDGSVSIAVTDSGIGIPAEERQHIFERFYQVRQSANSQAIGTGIGLNLVQSLVSLHHGQIELRDNPAGQGSQFVVTLPLGDSLYAPEELQESDTSVSVQTAAISATVTTASILNSTLRNEAPAQPEAKQSGIRHHILVVDDDEDIRQYLSQELMPYYHVTLCADGQQAYDLLIHDYGSKETPIDLVLTDLMMPMLDGIQLCQKIRSNVRINHIPVILLTAKTSDEDRLRSLEIGANAFVTKPFSMPLLLQTIRNIIDNQTRLRNTFSGQQVPADQVETPQLKSPDKRLLERVVRVVNDNLSNPDLTSEFIAREVGLSRVHLYRKLKELTNQSARSYIRNIRLTKAAELLSQQKMAVSEVAYQVGFSNADTFSIAFRDLYGLSPSEFMEQQAINNPKTR